MPRDESSLAFQLFKTHSCQHTSPSVKHQIAKPTSTDDRALPYCLLSRGLSLVANAMLWAIISIWMHKRNFFPSSFLPNDVHYQESVTLTGVLNSDKWILTWTSSIQNAYQAISLVSPHGLCASTRHGAKLQKPQSFANANYDLSIHKFSKLERRCKEGQKSRVWNTRGFHCNLMNAILWFCLSSLPHRTVCLLSKKTGTALFCYFQKIWNPREACRTLFNLQYCN